MAYACLLMDNLKKLIHGNYDPIINNNPMILSEMPQLQLLYQELASIIQTLTSVHQHHQHHELEKVRDLKKRFKDVADEAQDTIDIFLSAIHFTNIKLSRRLSRRQSRRFFRRLPRRSAVPVTSLDLENVMRSIESIKVEFMKMGSSPRNDSLKTHSARDAAGPSTTSTRNALGKMKPSLEEIVVGLDRDAEIIGEKLAGDAKQLSIVSIVGMGGLGKTTLATKLFNDPFLKYHFHIRAMATVSQTYIRRDLLTQILVSIGGVQQGLHEARDSQLREKLHKKLMGRRYLIIIDDIWSIQAWDDLRLFFPHENTKSRILLTTRINEVALHLKPHGFVHPMPCLTEEESWELLKLKVFHGDECPEWLIKPGMQIAKKCHGLPLSLVVMAGVLAKEAMREDLWQNIGCTVRSYIVGDEKECLETLALSYHHLPDHLRDCFVYLGGFPEDSRINVRRVIRLWVAEGFIEEVGNRSLEDTAKAYLMELISKNLVIVVKRNVIGDVKACKLHDLARELCVRKAKEEGFFFQIDSPTSSSQVLEGITYAQHRIFTNQNVSRLNLPRTLPQTIRTLVSFHMKVGSFISIPRCFVLLRVLDLQKQQVCDIPEGVQLLVHLRYLAIEISYGFEFPKSICKLWSLQTLIIQMNIRTFIDLPCDITDLVNLRHLWSNAWNFLCLPCIEKPMNLHSISKVILEDGLGNVQKCFPNIRKLVLDCGSHFQEHVKYLELLPYLENLKLMGVGLRWNCIAFPATLKKLSLIECPVPWSYMSIIQLLPNLEVLKLKDNSFTTTGRRWDACEQQFRRLKLLKLESLDIEQWEASSTSFPCLKELSVSYCKYLEEIPLEIGEIATLELIELHGCRKSLLESVERIQQEQHGDGNYELKISVHGM